MARTSPGGLKVLDDGIAMNLIQLSAWHALRWLQAQHLIDQHFYAREHPTTADNTYTGKGGSKDD